MCSSNVAFQCGAALMQALSLIKTEILRQNQQQCSYLLQVGDISKTDQPGISNNSLLSQDQHAVAIYCENYKNVSSIFSIRFGGCSLIINEVYSTNVSNKSEEYASQVRQKFSVFSLKNDFYIFLLKNSTEENVLGFARTKSLLLHAYFMLPRFSCIVSTFSLSLNNENLVHLSTYDPHSAEAIPSTTCHPQSSTKSTPDFQGSSLNAIVGCVQCDEILEEFKRTGKWGELMIAAAYDLCVRINGTLIIQPVLATARDEADEYGEWDEWTQPLVEGSAVLTSIIRLSTAKSKVIFATEAIIYDSIGFITAKPRNVGGLQKLPKLLTPLSFEVWLGLIISAGCLFIAIELSIYVRQQYSYANINNCNTSLRQTTGTSYFTLDAIFRPVMMQPGITRNYQRVLGSDLLYRVLLGMWLASLIILLCSYTTTMTSDIVSPVYERLPSTFSELADSNYLIFGEFWNDNVERDFASLNTTMSRKIGAKAMDTDVSVREVSVKVFTMSRRQNYKVTAIAMFPLYSSVAKRY